MDVRAIDTSAVSGHSGLHGAAPVSKLVAFALVLAAVVVQANVLVLSAIALSLLALAFGSRLPMRTLLPLVAYPAVFALVFSLASAPDALTAALFVVKAVTAALAAITLALTTPYPLVFAPLQSTVPHIVGDAMLMTYRAVFLLGDEFSHLVRAIRLRSGLSRGHPVRAAGATARALGSLLLYSLDLSQREYDIMRMRGYSGRLRVHVPPARSRPFDAALIAGAGATLALAVLWRVRAPQLNPYSWMPVLVALLGLAGAAVWRWSRR